MNIYYSKNITLKKDAILYYAIKYNWIFIFQFYFLDE